MTSKAPIISPCLAELERELVAGNTSALSNFWQLVINIGTPLIEVIPDDDTHVLVTFLWQETEKLRNILVAGAVVGWDVAENQMSRLLKTDLWYKTYKLRSDTRAIYRFSLNDPLIPWNLDNMEGRLAACHRDPLNHRLFIFPKYQDDPSGADTLLSVLELPDAPPQPWITERPEVPKGVVEPHHIHSAILRNERRAWIYTPPVITCPPDRVRPDAEPYGLLLLFDGGAYLEFIPAPTILDNLLAEGMLPPMVAVLLDSPPNSRNHELTCHPPFVDFLVHELVPWLHKHYNVTTDPRKTIVGGSSAGGLAAAYVGLRAPDIFGKVLSQSGSFWWNWDAEEKIAQQWLTHEFAISPKQPLHFYIDVGRLERISGYDLLMVNRHLRDVLLAKGYPVDYDELPGGHEYISWRGGFSDGLLALADLP